MENVDPIVVSNERLNVLDATDREGTLQFFYEWISLSECYIFAPEPLKTNRKSVRVTGANVLRIDRAAVACVEFLSEDGSKVEIFRRHPPGVIDSESVRARLAVARQKAAEGAGTSAPRFIFLDEPKSPYRKVIGALRRAFSTLLWGTTR